MIFYPIVFFSTSLIDWLTTGRSKTYVTTDFLSTMSQRAYFSSPAVDWKKSLVRDCYYQKHALICEKTASYSLLLSSLKVWSMDSCLRSPSLSQVYLSLTFQLSQTAVVKVEMSSTFPTVPVKLSNSQLYFFNEKLMGAVSRKEVSNWFVKSL